MGTFVHELGQLTIPDDKWQAFLQDAKCVLEQGGMFGNAYCNFMGKDIWLIRSPSETEKTIDVVYNYFDNDFMENAGVSLKRHGVYSGKIGWRGFNKATQALYYLAELYSSTPYSSGNDSRHDQIDAIQWLRYVLKRELHYGWRKHIWMLCEMEAERTICKGAPRVEDHFIPDFTADEVDQNEAIAVSSVLFELDRFINVENRKKVAENENDQLTMFSGMIMLYGAVREYRETSELSEEEQIQTVLSLLKKDEEKESTIKEFARENPPIAISSVVLLPQTYVKVMAEVYGRNFWELWWTIKDELKERSLLLEDKGLILEPYAEMSTEEFFHVDAWDRLYWWNKDGDVKLTEEIIAWLENLVDRYDELLEREMTEDIAGWQRRFVDLLASHPKACCFESLFFEFIGNFSKVEFKAAVMMMEEVATNEEEYRRLMSVMANKDLRGDFFKF